MSIFLKILGSLFLLLGVIGVITIIVAVATDNGTYPTFISLIPAVIFHLVSMLLGMVFYGLGTRKKQAAAAQ